MLLSRRKEIVGFVPKVEGVKIGGKQETRRMERRKNELSIDIERDLDVYKYTFNVCYMFNAYCMSDNLPKLYI